MATEGQLRAIEKMRAAKLHFKNRTVKKYQSVIYLRSWGIGT